MLWLLLSLALSFAQEECPGRIQGDHLRVDAAPITFDLGRTTLTRSSRAALDAIHCVLAVNPRLHLRIEVHSDDVGRADDARALTLRRAEAIRDALVSRGTDRARLVPAGLGPDRPIAPNNSVAGRAQNRRVELIALRPGEGLRAIEGLLAGLPPPDADGDGIPDPLDACPFEPETYNGYKDEDGCPDVAPGASPEPPRAPQAVARVQPAPQTAPEPPRPAARTLPSIDTPLRTGRRAQRESAVVIGLERYLRIPHVPHAERDASAFYDFLVFTRGIPGQKTQLLTKGGREHIIAAVTRAASEAGRGGRVWIYFAGHGAGDPTTEQRLLLGDDVSPDAIGFVSRGLPIADLERIVTDAGATPILVLDTCYAGVGRSGESIAGGTRFVVPDYALAPKTHSSQWTAAGPNQLSAPLPGTDHGAFTYFAIGALRGWADGMIDGVRDGKVTAAEANAFVAYALRRSGLADQQPTWLGDDDLVLAEGVTETGPF